MRIKNEMCQTPQPVIQDSFPFNSASSTEYAGTMINSEQKTESGWVLLQGTTAAFTLNGFGKLLKVKGQPITRLEFEPGISCKVF
jgi:hypothetical protein